MARAPPAKGKTNSNSSSASMGNAAPKGDANIAKNGKRKKLDTVSKKPNGKATAPTKRGTHVDAETTASSKTRRKTDNLENRLDDFDAAIVDSPEPKRSKTTHSTDLAATETASADDYVAEDGEEFAEESSSGSEESSSEEEADRSASMKRLQRVAELQSNDSNRAVHQRNKGK